MSTFGDGLFCATLFYKEWLVLYDFELLKSKNKPPINRFQEKLTLVFVKK